MSADDVRSQAETKRMEMEAQEAELRLKLLEEKSRPATVRFRPTTSGTSSRAPLR